MARLNETTAPLESTELLKRRFLRQNREIARTNSAQSVLIRDLESEVASLLSENLSLREEIVSLNQQVERLDAAKGLHDGVYDVKAKLDAKLGELNSLVADLGTLPCKYQGSEDANPKESSDTKRRASTSRMRHRAGSFGSHGFADEERLPTILENKSYPRQTLEPQEIQNLINEEQDAPVSSGKKSTTEEKPSAEEPTAEEPTAEEPTTEEPTTEEPTTEEPTTEEKPTAEEKPAVEEKPTAEKLTAEKLTAEKPSTESSSAETSSSEEKSLASLLGKTHSSRLNPKYFGRHGEPKAVKDETKDDNVPSTREVRRKTRLSPLKPEERTLRLRRKPSNFNADRNTKPMPGSKRKFDPEECGSHAAASSGSDDDFQFSRPARASQKPSEDTPSKQANRTPCQGQLDGRPMPRDHEPSKRKVLEPKSTNANVRVSPRGWAIPAKRRDNKTQQKQNGEGENCKPYTEFENKAADKRHSSNEKPAFDQPKEMKGEAKDVKRRTKQEKSAVLKEIAASQAQEASSSEENASNAPSRPSRRQKSVVSYAEPNLRDKMRRPTGDFTDAVGNRIPRRSSSCQATCNSASAEELGGLSKESSASPPEKPMGMVSQRKRRTLPAKGDDPRDDPFLESEAHDRQLAKGHTHSQQAGAASKTRHRASLQKENYMASPTTGSDSPHAESKPCQLSNTPPSPGEDTMRAKRGQHVATRRRSMMV